MMQGQYYSKNFSVAELKYEIEKSMILNSYSLRLERLCVR
jgi:hypothetical protein